MSAFTKFTRHPAMESSAPSTLTAQLPREYVRAVRFSGSHQAPRQVPVTNLEDLSFRKYNQFQDSIDNMGFKPILRPQPDHSVFSPIDGLMDKSGSGLFDFLDPNKNGVAKAFDPKRNGVAKAFDPKQNGVANAFDPNKNGVAKAFDPKQNGVAKFVSDKGIDKFVTKTLPSTLIHQGIPAVAGFLGSKVGLGDQAKKLGDMGANELGKVTGMGFKKGSPEMKAHMAKLRSMRKKK